MKFKFIILTTLAILMWSCSTTTDISPIVEDTDSNTNSEITTQEDTAVENIADDSEAKLALEESNKARKEAIDAKAPKAAQDEFDNAENLYLKAAESFNNANYIESTTQFKEATLLFIKSKDIALEKRDIALKALMEAEQAIAQTELNAKNAIEEGVEVE